MGKEDYSHGFLSCDGHCHCHRGGQRAAENCSSDWAAPSWAVRQWQQSYWHSVFGSGPETTEASARLPNDLRAE